jgi:hypothetical protein
LNFVSIVCVLVRSQKYKQTNTKNKGRKKLFADYPLAALAAIARVIQHRPDAAALQCWHVERVARVPNVLRGHYDGGRTRQQVAEFVFHAIFIEPRTTQNRQDEQTSVH